jgi:hypothetical protein
VRLALEFFAQIVGLLAVLLFLLSYQQKERKNIITMNAISRVHYIIQYIMLGAFEGAVLDVMGALASVLAQKKEASFIKKHLKTVVIIVNVAIVAVGLCLYENVYSLLPIFGVLLHTGAFWISDERTIRRLSLIGSPFWLAYNLVSRAYGSSIGDILSMASIIIAMFRYDFVRNRSDAKREETHCNSEKM